MKKGCKKPKYGIKKAQVGIQNLPDVPSNLDQLMNWTVLQHNLFSDRKPQPTELTENYDLALMKNVMPGFQKFHAQNQVTAKDNNAITNVTQTPPQEERIGVFDPRRSNLHPLVEKANEAMLAVTGVSNIINNNQAKKQEALDALSSMQPKAWENMERYGLNANPVYTKYGGHASKYQVGGQANDMNKWLELKKKYASSLPTLKNGQGALDKRMEWMGWANQALPTSGTPTELAAKAAKATGFSNPALLLSSALEEGIGNRFKGDDSYSDAYLTANEKGALKGYAVDGFRSYGLDMIGSRVDEFINKGYLPQDFKTKMKAYDASNEIDEKSYYEQVYNLGKQNGLIKDFGFKADYGTYDKIDAAMKAYKGQLPTMAKSAKTAAFVDDESAMMAKAAFMRAEQDNLNGYIKKKGYTLTPEETNFFTLAAYNGGFGAGQQMLDYYGQKKLLGNNGFMKDRMSAKGQIYDNVLPRLAGANLFAGEGYFGQPAASTEAVATQKPKTNTLTGQPTLQMGGQANNLVEAEQGEVFQDTSGDVLNIPNSAPTHEDGGVIIPDVHKVLENTSRLRKDNMSKALQLHPMKVKELTGMDASKHMSHAEAAQKANSMYDEQKFKILKNIERAAKDKKDLDKYAAASINLNLNTVQAMPSKQEIFDNLFNHQEVVKAQLGIETGDTAQYGGFIPKAQAGYWDGKGNWITNDPKAKAEAARQAQAAAAVQALAPTWEQAVLKLLPTHYTPVGEVSYRQDTRPVPTWQQVPASQTGQQLLNVQGPVANPSGIAPQSIQQIGEALQAISRNPYANAVFKAGAQSNKYAVDTPPPVTDGGTLYMPKDATRGTTPSVTSGSATTGRAKSSGAGTSTKGTSGGGTRSLYGEDVFNSAGYETIYPGSLKDKGKTETVPTVQHKRGSGMYGEADWDMNDFYGRHDWVKQERPNFDPKNAEDVKWFQKRYDEKFQEYFGTKYFNEQGHRKVDGKFGEGTWSTPSLKEVAKTKQEEVEKVEIEIPGEEGKRTYEVKNDVTSVKNPESKFFEPLRWYDLASPLAAYMSALERVPAKYNPAEVNQLRFKLQDPTAALNQNQADFNTAAQIAANAPTGVGVNAANVANLAAQKYAANNQLLGQYENQNAQIKNNEITYNTQVRDKQAILDQAARKVHETEVLDAMAKQQEQKLKGLDGIVKTIAQNKALNRNGNLIMKFAKAFDQYGDYNGYQTLFSPNPAAGINAALAAQQAAEKAGKKPAAGGLQKLDDNTFYNRQTGKVLYWDGKQLLER